MLTLTENASQIVTALVADQTESSDAGLRISGPTDDGFAITAVTGAEPGDQVVAEGDAKVYVDQTAAMMLDDKVLDAQVTDQGGVQFALAEQP
ncbi:Fe-S cluster assembly iron-binding protein IscA [Mumia flava]|uniref:Fe-S cluster assembly iron-binding protein IscA n=1 Tax=Mumia flava TaxID=1348852 RepID=A0A0B2BE75_9ACTN|nr:hypothetical protein [Mumia flava]PJJ53721.1 Fe-S cluster assembly iron-binding protein IscA [Mumia flava]